MSGQDDSKAERIAILKIFGFSFNLWHIEVSNKIGKTFGAILEHSLASHHDHNLYYDKVTVLTSIKKIFNEMVRLIWKERSYDVIVSEEEREWCLSFLASSTTVGENYTSGTGDPKPVKESSKDGLGIGKAPGPTIFVKNKKRKHNHSSDPAQPMSPHPSVHPYPSHSSLDPDHLNPSSEHVSAPTSFDPLPRNFPFCPFPRTRNQSVKETEPLPKQRTPNPTRLLLPTPPPPFNPFPPPFSDNIDIVTSRPNPNPDTNLHQRPDSNL